MAETGEMVLFVVALLIWFALSVPATLIVGRMIAASSRNTVTTPRARPMASAGHAALAHRPMSGPVSRPQGLLIPRR